MQEDEKLQEYISDSLQKRITKTQEDIETKQTEKAQQECQKSGSFFFNFLACVFVFLIPSAIWAFPVALYFSDKNNTPVGERIFFLLLFFPIPVIVSLIVSICSFFIVVKKSFWAGPCFIVYLMLLLCSVAFMLS